MNQENDEDRRLYRFEYLEPEDQQTYVDWVWLKDEEIDDYRSGYATIKFRPATTDEENLYDEAYADGYGIAAMMEFEDRYDGITFRVEVGSDGELDMQGTKMFECGVCGTHKDFDTEVGMVAGLFLGEVKNDKLWHVCYGCAENAAMLKTIEDGMEN